MKHTLLILTVCIHSISASGQILNGGFENNSNPDLSHWAWTCLAESDSSAPTGGGDWSIMVWGGNTQGCFPGYAYQKIPAITNGQTFLLTGWSHSEIATHHGLYFGSINNGVITLQSGDTTSSTNWTQLSVQSSFSLSTGDTAIVALYGGLSGGFAASYASFDLINLQQMTGTNSLAQNQSLKVYPNPIDDQAVIRADKILYNATLTLSDNLGRIVKQMNNLNGQKIILKRDNLPAGFYFIHLYENNKTIAIEKLMINH